MRLSTTFAGNLGNNELQASVNAIALALALSASSSEQRTNNLIRLHQFASKFTMSSFSRPLPSHLRQGSTTNLTSNSGPSPILLARISEKKAELENLKQLRDLSAGLAGQMQMLEEKLATLSDGTEGTLWHFALK